MAIGETGTLEANTPNSGGTAVYEVRVELTEPLDDPVIVLIATNRGGNKYALRVTGEETNTDGETIAFTFTFDEYEYHDGPHPAVETVNWLAIEEGTHTLPDGRTVVAGKTTANDDNDLLDAGETVTFPADTFQDDPNPPVVLTTVEGPNPTIPPGSTSNALYGPATGNVVDSDPSMVTTDGFKVELNAGEAYAPTGISQTVGYIAIQQGTGTADDPGTSQVEGGLEEGNNVFNLDDTFTNPIVLAETQTINDDDPGTVILRDNGFDPTTETNLEFEEEQSLDNELDHEIPETVGIVVFEAGLILCFTSGTRILTAHGEVRIEDLAVGDLIVTKDNGLQPLRWTGTKTIDLSNGSDGQDVRPITIPAHSFGPNLPSRDLTVSPQHRILLTDGDAELMFGSKEVLAPAKALASSRRHPVDRTVTYVHLLFDTHQIIFANGLETESLHPGHLTPSALDHQAKSELFTLFPELRGTPQSYGPACRKVLKPFEAALIRPTKWVH
ncbi:MAG: Hint domain-containing protein [Pseudomonadota bacterium]